MCSSFDKFILKIILLHNTLFKQIITLKITQCASNDKNNPTNTTQLSLSRICDAKTNQRLWPIDKTIATTSDRPIYNHVFLKIFQMHHQTIRLNSSFPHTHNAPPTWKHDEKLHYIIVYPFQVSINKYYFSFHFSTNKFCFGLSNWSLLFCRRCWLIIELWNVQSDIPHMEH